LGVFSGVVMMLRGLNQGEWERGMYGLCSMCWGMRDGCKNLFKTFKRGDNLKE
jgi:hypothetical protein